MGVNLMVADGNGGATGTRQAGFADEGVGVSYCLDLACPASRVLSTRLPSDRCPLCAGATGVERVRGRAPIGAPRFAEVRLHFDFLPETRSYHAMARVRNDAAPPGGGVYVVYNPLIRTPKHALSTAERILAALEGKPGGRGNRIMMARPQVLSLDEPRWMFRLRLASLFEAPAPGPDR